MKRRTGGLWSPFFCVLELGRGILYVVRLVVNVEKGVEIKVSRRGGKAGDFSSV